MARRLQAFHRQSPTQAGADVPLPSPRRVLAQMLGESLRRHSILLGQGIPAAPAMASQNISS